MTEDKFWEIIGQSQAGHDANAQIKALEKILWGLGTDEVAAFDRIFTQLLIKSYTWDLWGAAYIIDGGCSDDGFEYFRRGLIASGREKFEKALENPESLADWTEPDEVENEGIKYVSYKVYEEKSGGGKMPDDGLRYPSNPSGEPWEEDNDDLERRFPALWAKFSS